MGGDLDILQACREGLSIIQPEKAFTHSFSSALDAWENRTTRIGSCKIEKEKGRPGTSCSSTKVKSLAGALVFLKGRRSRRERIPALHWPAGE